VKEKLNKKKYFDLTPILDTLLSDKNIVYKSSAFAETYEEHINNGGNPNDF